MIVGTALSISSSGLIVSRTACGANSLRYIATIVPTGKAMLSATNVVTKVPVTNGKMP